MKIEFLTSDIIRIDGDGSITNYYMIGGNRYTKPGNIGSHSGVLSGKHFISFDKSSIYNPHHIPLPYTFIEKLLVMEEGNLAKVSRRGLPKFIEKMKRFRLKIGFIKPRKPPK